MSTITLYLTMSISKKPETISEAREAKKKRKAKAFLLLLEVRQFGSYFRCVFNHSGMNVIPYGLHLFGNGLAALLVVGYDRCGCCVQLSRMIKMIACEITPFL